MPFVRIFRQEHGRTKQEVLFNTDHISKIEVEYGVPSEGDPEDRELWHVDPETGAADESAVRFYRVFFGGESAFLVADPNDPVVKVIEEIYNNAVKG
jgi:hypothetical protein